MKTKIILVNFVSFFLMFALVTAAYAQTRVVGVEVGDKSTYTVGGWGWGSNDPNAVVSSIFLDYNETAWIEISVTAISGTNITGQNTKHYKNGTEIIADGWVDVDSGNGSLTSYFISANLTAGDLIYTSPYHVGEFINETVYKGYQSGPRETNHFDATLIGGSSNMSYDFQWDKLTGVLVETYVRNYYLTGNYWNSWSVLIQISSSDVWVIPEFSTWTAMLIILVVLAAGVVIFKQRLRK